MDPIQQRLQAIYQQKPESDIDRKLKSASTTVLDQRIAFHDASKVSTCPNSQLKGKYLFMKPSTNMQKPSINNVPVQSPTPAKKDSKSQNNSATQPSVLPGNDLSDPGYGKRKSCYRSRSPLTRKSKNRSPKTRRYRSRSPLMGNSRRSPVKRKPKNKSHIRKSRSRSPSERKSRSKFPLDWKSRSRSLLNWKSRNRSPPVRKSRSLLMWRSRRYPLTCKSRSRSPPVRKSRSRSPLTKTARKRSQLICNSTETKKSRSRSPLGRWSRSRAPLTRKSRRSRSPLTRRSRSRSPLTRISRSRSPLTRRSRSRSPLTRKSRSRSPRRRRSRSRSPLTRISRSRSPLTRRSRSRSPLTRKSRSRSPLVRKSKGKSSLTEKSRSGSPQIRKSRSKQYTPELSREARSRSPLLRYCENKEKEYLKQTSSKKVEKRRRRKFLTPFYVEESDSDEDDYESLQIFHGAPSYMYSPKVGYNMNTMLEEQTSRKLLDKWRLSPRPGTSIEDDDTVSPQDRAHSSKMPFTKSVELPFMVKSKAKNEDKIHGVEIEKVALGKSRIPPSWRSCPKSTKKSQGERQVKKKNGTKSFKKTEKRGKAKQKTRHSTSSDEDSEPEVIRKHGTSTRPAACVNTADEQKENRPCESQSGMMEKDETLNGIDFREYLPDNFDKLSYYPSDEDVSRLDFDVNSVFTQGEDGDNMPRPNTVLFPEHRLDYSWKFPEGGCGLINRGNTCFVNAALQCLTYCPPFVNYLLSGQHAQECRMMHKDRCILCSFTRYLHESLKMINKHNIVPNWFLNNLYCVAKHFSLGRQEDSHEYLRLSLEQMQKVCLVGHNQLDKYSKETTVVNQIFGGFLRSQVVCLKCKAKSNTYDPFLDISLDIRTCNTLERAFEIFVSPEKLDIENAYKCANCKQKVEALKRFTIHKAPNVMTVQLKRFQATHDDKFGGMFRGVKINKAVRFPPRLNIRGYMSNRHGPPELYSLYALLFHEGHSANSGHYTCTVKSGNKWFHISDGTKIRTSLHTVNLQDVYVLFYMREDKQPNGIIQNPSVKTEDNHRGKESKNQQQRHSSYTTLSSTQGAQRPSASNDQKPSPSGTSRSSPLGVQKFIGPVKPKLIHINEFQVKPIKTNTSSGTPDNDVGQPVKRKDSCFTPHKQDTIKVPLSADRNRVSFGIKTPGKAHQSSYKSQSANAQMAKSQSEPSLGLAKPRIVMQIKNGKATTIEKSPDGQKKILSDDEEVIAKTNGKKSHKKYRKSILVPYGNESSSDSDSDRDNVQKVKRERKSDSEVVFDTKLNATTSVPGNTHLMKSISSHIGNGDVVKHREKPQNIEATKSFGASVNGVHTEKLIKQVDDDDEKRGSDKSVKSEGTVHNDSLANINGHHVFMKHPNGRIHIYDTEPIDNNPLVKNHSVEDKQHSHTDSQADDKYLNGAKKRKLIEDARIENVNGDFHVVSDKKPLLSTTENGHGDGNFKKSVEYNILKKAKKHKKHKKDKHRHKDHRYETLVNEDDNGNHSEEHHVKKHKKKKKRKHKERDYDLEEEHSYKKRKPNGFEERDQMHEEHSYDKPHKHRQYESGEDRIHKHHETAENRVHKHHETAENRVHKHHEKGEDKVHKHHENGEDSHKHHENGEDRVHKHYETGEDRIHKHHEIGDEKVHKQHETGEERVHKHYGSGDSRGHKLHEAAEDRVHKYEAGFKVHKHTDLVNKRYRTESESSSSGEFEWVEKKVDAPVKLSKSAAW